MVLGLRSKTKRFTSVQVEYFVEVLEIKPWPASQSQKSIRSVVLQWENGDRNFGLTNPITPSLAEEKIEINESFRLQVTLMKESSGKNNDNGGFHKNILQLHLHEPKKDKTVKGQLLGTAILDMAQHGIIKDSLRVGVPMNFKRSFRNITQPVLYIKLQSFEKNGPESSSRDGLSKKISLDRDGKESVSTLMSEEYAEEDEIASFTDDDVSSHSSLTNSSSLVENNADLPLQTNPGEQSQIEVMEQCVARLDVALFNALLHESVDETLTDPVADPIINHKVLPVPPGKSSFGAGAQLKNAIGNWSRSLTDLFDMDADDSSLDENDEYDEKVDVTTSLKSFHLLNALSDLFMLPKDMLLEKKVRKEVCATFSSSVIRRILSSFFPDEFCPDQVPASVFDALDSEDQMLSSEDGMVRNLPCSVFPISYSPPSAASIQNIIGDLQSTSQLKWSGSSVVRKCHASDDELKELDSPLSAIILDKSSFPSVKAKEKTSGNPFRYQLLRDVWKFND